MILRLRYSQRIVSRRGRRHLEAELLDLVEAGLLEAVAVGDKARRDALRDVVSQRVWTFVVVVHAVEGFRVLGLGIHARMIGCGGGL